MKGMKGMGLNKFLIPDFKFQMKYAFGFWS